MASSSKVTRFEWLGGAVRGFKDGVKEGSTDKPAETAAASQKMDGNIIEGEIKEKSKSA